MDLVKISGNIEKRAGTENAVALNVSSHTVGKVDHGLSWVCLVCVVVDNRGLVEGIVGTHWIQALIPVNMASQVSINLVLEQDAFESIADIGLVRGDLGAVHRAMTHDNDPRSLGAVDAGQILLEPLELLVGGVGLPVTTVNGTEWAGVSDEGLALGGQGLVGLFVADEWPRWAVWEIGLGLDRDKVANTVVERVPEVADTTTLSSWHAESMLIGSEISSFVS